MQLIEIIQRVQSLYSKGVQSKDTRLTDRHIFSAINTARSILLKQQYSKSAKINEWAYQTLSCVELQQAPVHECPCVPTAGCKILRTKHKIPKPISGIDRHMIKSVTTLDGNQRFDETDFETAKFAAKGNKYTNNKPDYYFRNGYLYLTSRQLLKAVTITGLFNDPLEAKQFPSICGDCEDCECQEATEMDYPIDGDLVKPLIQIANDELIIMFKQMAEDKNANAADDSTINSAMIHQPNSE